MIALSALLVLLAPVQERSDELEPVRAALRRAFSAEEAGAEVLVQRLARLGPEAVPALYGLATGRDLALLTSPEWRPEAWLCRPEDISVLGARALERAPRAAVLAELTRALEAGPKEQECLIVLRLLGAQGSAEALPLVWRAVDALGELELGRPSAHRDLGAALSSILKQDPRAWPALEQGLAALEPDLLEILVEAVGACERVRGMAFLRDRFVREVPDPELVLAAMARLEEALPWELAGQTFQACSDWLEDIDPSRRAFAAGLAGRLHAREAIPALLALVEDEADARVRTQVLGALRALAGADHGTSSASWTAWHESEVLWREERWDALAAVLVSPKAGPANAALAELVAHPLQRHEVATLLAETLLQQPRAVSLASCAELVNLRSRVPLPILYRALRAAPPQLSARIGNVLEELVAGGRELPSERIQELLGS